MRATNKHIRDSATLTQLSCCWDVAGPCRIQAITKCKSLGYNTGDVYGNVLWTLGRHLQKCAKFSRLSRYKILLYYLRGKNIGLFIIVFFDIQFKTNILLTNVGLNIFLLLNSKHW